MHVVAIDWSGRKIGAEQTIWRADVVDGALVALRNGRSREQVVEELVAEFAGRPDVVIGLDFAFSFPAWWCAEQGWSSGHEVWAAMRDDGEALLATCAPPLWGRPRRPDPNPPERAFRVTEREAGVGRPKSVFQIGGAGSVGTGSIRGMPHLLTLAEAGFAIWPLQCGRGGATVVELYPRVFTGPLTKRDPAARRACLDATLDGEVLPAPLRERAAASEDAFDAAVSGVAMARHSGRLTALRPSVDPAFALEGRIWTPRL